MADHPRRPVTAGHTEAVPRRIRAVVGGATVVDTTAATYLWEHPRYPQYAIPLGDVAAGALTDEGAAAERPGGPARRHGLVAGGVARPGAAWVFGPGAPPELAGRVRLEWDAVDAWYEEDDQVFVHPRDPYTRVDALLSSRHVLVSSGGLVLAESRSPVLVFETGLPTRAYLDRSAVRFEHLRPSTTVTACPYKGTTSGWWSAGDGADVAWSYDHPTREALPVAGLVAFFQERVDVTVDGRPLPA